MIRGEKTSAPMMAVFCVFNSGDLWVVETSRDEEMPPGCFLFNRKQALSGTFGTICARKTNYDFLVRCVRRS